MSPALSEQKSSFTRKRLIGIVALLIICAAIIAIRRFTTIRVQPLWVSLAIYVAFSAYWTVEARNSAPVKRSESNRSRLVHQCLVNVSLALLFLRIPGLNGRWLPEAPALLPVGIAVQAVSVLLAVWARRHLGRNWSAAVTAKVDHVLIRSGPYRLVRHPIYTAMFGMYIGVAVASGEWHAFAAVILLAAAYWRKIRSEERNLDAIFGPAYEQYRNDTWALLPWLI